MSIPQGLIRVIWEQSETSFCLCVFYFDHDVKWFCLIVIKFCLYIATDLPSSINTDFRLAIVKNSGQVYQNWKKKRFVRRKKNDKHHVLPIVPIKYFMKGNTWSINQTNWINYSHWFLLIKLQILPDSLFLY